MQIQLGKNVYETIYDEAVSKNKWRSEARQQNILEGFQRLFYAESFISA